MTLTALNNQHMLVAHLLAEGHHASIIAERTGYSEAYVRALALDTLVKLKVREVRDEIQSIRTQNAADLATFFDDVAVDAALNIVELGNHAENEAVRLKANQDILARSPSAPKAVKFVPSITDKRLIQLGVAAVDAMKEALTEGGKGNVVELLEGEDWKEVPAGTIAQESVTHKGVQVKEA